jgi:DNA-binding MarR family transcriptional regulator
MTNSIPIKLYEEIPESSLTEIFELIDQTSKNLKRIKRQTVSDADLTPPQYAILNMLWEKDARPFKVNLTQTIEEAYWQPSRRQVGL